MMDDMNIPQQSSEPIIVLSHRAALSAMRLLISDSHHTVYGVGALGMACGVGVKVGAGIGTVRPPFGAMNGAPMNWLPRWAHLMTVPPMVMDSPGYKVISRMVSLFEFGIRKEQTFKCQRGFCSNQTSCEFGGWFPKASGYLIKIFWVRADLFMQSLKQRWAFGLVQDG